MDRKTQVDVVWRRPQPEPVKVPEWVRRAQEQARVLGIVAVKEVR